MTSPLRTSPSLAAVFGACAARADKLAAATATAREPLKFAAGLLRAQGAVAADIGADNLSRPYSGRLAADGDRILPHALKIARFAEKNGPGALATEAEGRLGESHADVQRRLMLFWTGEVRAYDDYLSRSMLRPFVAVLRSASITPDRPHARGHCPFCGGPPATSCRRGGSETDGGARLLCCALCGLEWAFNRILCPSCFESDPKKLPSFADEGYSSARIEACDTCGRYVKSIDTSHDPRAIPEIDDVASIAMDLWAVAQGYTRIEPGLAGL